MKILSHHCRIVITVSAIIALGGCRGDISDKPPIHLNPNMDNQRYYQAQEPNPFFADERAMRPQVPGTIAIGEMRDNSHLHQGKIGGKFADKLAIRLSPKMLAYGKQRYEIYCTPCHGFTGESKEAVLVKRGIKVRPPSYLDPRLRAMPLGQIFHTMSNGVRNMPPFKAQIPVADRWAIAAYVRVLQVAGTASIERVPRAVAKQKGWRK